MWTVAGHPTITINSGNVFSGTAPTVTPNSDFSPLQFFNRLTPADFGSIFQQLGNSLGGAGPSLNFNGQSELPFLNENLGQLFGSGSVSVQAIEGQINGPANGRLTADAVFSIAGNATPVGVITVKASSTQQNQNLADLIGDINTALTAANLSGEIQAVATGSKIEFRGVDLAVSGFSIQIADPTNPAVTQLGFANAQQSSPTPAFDFVRVDVDDFERHFRASDYGANIRARQRSAQQRQDRRREPGLL